MADHGVKIRKGVKEDIPAVYRLFKNLMVTDNIKPDHTIDEQVLLSNGFGERPFFELIVAEIASESGSDDMVGFGMYHYHFSTFAGRAIDMEAIYVDPDHQKKGIGKLLWQSIVRIGLENDCVRCIFCAFGHNKATEFYKKWGAIDFTSVYDDHVFHMTKDAMVKFASSSSSSSSS